MTAQSPSIDALDFATTTVSCPSGKRPIAGGGSSAGPLVLMDSFPRGTEASGFTGWSVTMLNLDDAPQTFTVYAVCASV